LKTVSDRVDSFLVHNPTITKADIPSDLVTASGSGLDPDISLQAAKIQVDRIAKIRNLNKDKINALIEQQKHHSVFNGIEKLNVLSLNLALDQIK
jgi:K+-transporting ATPase ATPase C chain